MLAERGNWDWSCGITARMASVTAMVLARRLAHDLKSWMDRSWVVALYIHAACLVFSTLSTTLAISFNRTGAPFLQDTIMLPNCAAFYNSALVVRV